MKRLWTNWKKNKEKEAWEKKLEEYAHRRFGITDFGRKGGQKVGVLPASFLRRDAYFRKGKNPDKGVRGELFMMKKVFSKLVVLDRAADVVLERGMLLLNFKSKAPGEPVSDPDSDDLIINLAGAVVIMEGKRGFKVRRKVYKEDTELFEYKTYRFRTKDEAEQGEWMLGFAKVPGVIRRFTDYFEVGVVVGEGGTAVVRECIHRYSGERYAVKRPLRNKVGLQNLHNELRILQVCVNESNPGIPLLEDFFYDSDDNLFVVMELLTGGELLDQIVKEDHFTEYHAKETVRKILVGLSYLHSKGIAHRDLKPENLVFSHSGEDSPLKIVDFDLAKLLGAGETTTPCGTSHYMAPEMVGGHKYRLAVDMWSLGCIVFILLCGRYPFWADTRNERDRRIYNCEYEFHPKLWQHVSDTAKGFVCSLLQKEAGDRMTVLEAMEHPWLKTSGDYQASWEEEAEASRAPALNTVANIKEVIGSPEFKQMKLSFSESITTRHRADSGMPNFDDLSIMCVDSPNVPEVSGRSTDASSSVVSTSAAFLKFTKQRMRRNRESWGKRSSTSSYDGLKENPNSTIEGDDMVPSGDLEAHVRNTIEGAAERAGAFRQTPHPIKEQEMRSPFV